MPETPVKAINLCAQQTEELLEWAQALESSGQSPYEISRSRARRLGGHQRQDGLTEIGFWTPELSAKGVEPQNIVLEVFTACKQVDLEKQNQEIEFRRDYIRIRQQGDYHWGVLSGLRAGSREQMGSLYWLRYHCPNTGTVRIIGDCMGQSFPFGIHAPAELYDMDHLQRSRTDINHFSKPSAIPTSILQLHVNTSSPNGKLSGLTKLYKEIARKIDAGEVLSAAEENFVGFEAIQLLPIEPTVEHQGNRDIKSSFFKPEGGLQDAIKVDSATESLIFSETTVKIELSKPNVENWGYDVPLFGGAAVSPSILESGRPDELIDFIQVLHTFPDYPISLIFDLVYGHADNQALDLLNRLFIKGPNMYGQDVNHQNQDVRAILLEMQRRKVNTGADGIRVDGGQDFTYFKPSSGKNHVDDWYLLSMADTKQEIGGFCRGLFTIFEDGRPWPAEGWEEISTYRDLVILRPDVYQWGPLIFAHNTPSLEGFWDKKWRRVGEQMELGSRWITGCCNHDTLRRGTQVDLDLNINRRLGNELPEILANAYNNYAISTLTYGFSPGMPMDFINGLMSAPWGFVRNTDDQYEVKVVAEEARGFLDWQITEERYREDKMLFKTIKKLGFERLDSLLRFLEGLEKAITTEYNLEKTVQDVQSLYPNVILDIAGLKGFARAFMEDAHAACNVWQTEQQLDPIRSSYNLELRRFRHINPWLRDNLSKGEELKKLNRNNNTVFYGVRNNPDNNEALGIIAHMGGEDITIKPEELLPSYKGIWKVIMASPDIKIDKKLNSQDRIVLCDSDALLISPFANQQ